MAPAAIGVLTLVSGTTFWVAGVFGGGAWGMSVMTMGPKSWEMAACADGVASATHPAEATTATIPTASRRESCFMDVLHPFTDRTVIEDRGAHEQRQETARTGLGRHQHAVAHEVADDGQCGFRVQFAVRELQQCQQILE